MREHEQAARCRTRAVRLLESRPVLERLLHWRDQADPRATAEELAAVAAELVAMQERDGSWQHSLTRTAETLLLLHEVTRGEGDDVRVAATAALEWIRRTQDAPGAFASECHPGTHALGLCMHEVRGFFAPAPPDVDLGGLALLAGQPLGEDGDARLAGSALALAAALHWDPGGEAWTPQLAGVRRVVLLAAGTHSDMAPGYVLPALLRALLASPAEHATAAAGLIRFCARQRGDGSWPDVDNFAALELLADAAAAGHAVVVRGAILRVVRTLALTQQADGGWGRQTTPAQLRALIRAAGMLLETEPESGS